MPHPSTPSIRTAVRGDHAPRQSARVSRDRRASGGRFVAALLAFGAVALLTGCTGDGGASDFTGAWGTAGDQKPQLVIEEGTFSGTDGCNRLSGSTSVSGDTIAFEQVVMTKMACFDVDDWLNALATARVVDGALEVRDANDEVIGSLERE